MMRQRVERSDSIRILALALACAVVPLLGSASAQSTWTCPAGFEGQTLNVYNWSTYIADDTIANFEAACGVRVVYDTYPTDDDMLVRLRQGNPGFDIVVPSDVVATLMIEDDLLMPLDMSALPGFVNLDDTFLDLSFDPGNAYTVPYQWGTVGIGYNATRVGDITSWAELFAHDGTVAWLDDVTAMIGVALIMTGHDPNSSVPAELEEAKDFLIENGTDEKFGARPLRRAIENKVEDPLSEAILRGEYQGKHRIQVTTRTDEDGEQQLTFKGLADAPDADKPEEPVGAGNVSDGT